MKGYIDSIETMGLVDGPGIRFVVFLQGCPLRCLFCHNPETWNISNKLVMEPEELVRRIYKYKGYFKANGGVTFSGGEPLFQKEFLKEILKLCKKMDIHTCIDTSGYGDDYDEILKYTDLVLFDIKALNNDMYKKITGKEIYKSLEFLDKCQKLNKDLWIRQVIIPGINDNEEYIYELSKFIKKIKNVKKIEFLPYHTYGVAKYEKLGISYRLEGVPQMNNEKCEELYNLLLKQL